MRLTPAAASVLMINPAILEFISLGRFSIVLECKRDEERAIDQRVHSLVMINLEPLNSDRSILAQKPVDNACIVAAGLQSDLDFSNDPWVRGIGRARLGRRNLFIATRSQRNNHSD